MQRFDPSHFRQHAKVCVARIVLGLAGDPLDTFFRRTMLVHRLTHLRRDKAAGVDGEGQLNADRALLLVQERAARRAAVLECVHPVVAQLAGAADQVQ